MELSKKELEVLCGVLNGINTLTSTHNPFTKKYNIEEYINDFLNMKEIDILHEKLCNQLKEKIKVWKN